MTLARLYKNLKPYVRPYRRLVIATLLLTAIGSFAAQVNALILRYTVDHINGLALESKPLQEGFDLLINITIVLLVKELVKLFLKCTIMATATFQNLSKPGFVHSTCR